MLINNLNNDIINHLSQSEMNVLQYIESHGQDVITMSIQELANNTYTSTATILRLCKKIHFSGYSELKFTIKQTLSLASSPTKFMIQHENITQMVFNDLYNTSQIINPQALENMIHLIQSKKRIHFFGEGLTGDALQYFGNYLMALGRKSVFFHQTPKMINHAVSKMSEQDILILASASGNSASALRSAQIAHSNLASVVAISGFNHNALAKIADINFQFFVEERNHLGTDIKSRLCMFYLVDIIIDCYIEKNKKNEEVAYDQLQGKIES